MFETLRWTGERDGTLVLIDQTRLPAELSELECRDVETVARAIRTLQVRGAPAIGIAAAYGVCLGLQECVDLGEEAFFGRLRQVVELLAHSRPTAVNLFAALDRVAHTAESLRGRTAPREIATAVLAEARALHAEDRAMCAAIGRHGAPLLADGDGVLTHCNAGGLATGGTGTALAVLWVASEQGKKLHVFADETRPLLQGARLTSWELGQRGIACTLICDSMAAQVMREGRIQAVIVGADRIAANGDTANKIGTYGLAVLARAHGIPFYVAAPITTLDFQLADGQGIPIEQRAADEITHWRGVALAPRGVQVYNPAFDVTPATLISALITDRGVVRPVTAAGLLALLGPASISPQP